jgi:type I restriction enzyme R subunit
MNTYNENTLELTTLDWLSQQGYEVLHGPEIDPDSENPLRSDYDEVVLEPVLRESIVRINGALSEDIVDDAMKQIVNISHPNIVEANKQFHKMLTDGVDVSYRNDEGESATAKVYIIDSDNVENNTFMAINQLSIR